MKEITLTPRKNLRGQVKILPSKSYAHRLLICSALCKENDSISINFGNSVYGDYVGYGDCVDYGDTVSCPPLSDDIIATIDCLKSLGAKIEKIEKITRTEKPNSHFDITPILPTPENKDTLPITLTPNESGSTLRFILPVCCTLGINANLKMGGRLPNRPLSPLWEQLTSHGCILNKNGDTLTTSGKLKSGNFVLGGNVSSQFISGLLFALPLIEGDSTIEIKGKLESKPYVDMTVEALSLFGVDITFTDNRYFIKGKGRYTAPKETLSVEGDWSNSAFWLCLGVLGENKITCRGLSLNSKQGDKAILDIISAFGGDVVVDKDKITTTKKERENLKGITVDCTNTPDLVPIVAGIASTLVGEQTLIKGIERLRLKESDRVKSVCTLITDLGGSAVEVDDGILIKGTTLKGGTVDSFGDHRIVMTAAILSSECKYPVTIRGFSAVTKSYPDFFEILKSLESLES